MPIPRLLAALDGKVEFIRATTGASAPDADEQEKQSALAAARFRSFVTQHNSNWKRKHG